MALLKKIPLESGIEVSYHRVASVCSITNVVCRIEISSYASRAKRHEEKIALASVGKSADHDVFIETEFIDVPYDQSITVSTAYEYVKTLPKYKGAIDALEDEGAGLA